MTEIVFIDLFSGIGGFAEGFRRAGLTFKYHAFSEVDKNAISIYRKHFPEAKELGDVRTIRDFSAIRNQRGGAPLVVTFGFPCQDLSVAGKRRGLEGSRSGLFFEAMRVIRELQPDVFIFENVKGLLSSNKGQDFVRCLQEIADLGNYDGQWQLVNTSWVLPQNRERIYFIGTLRGQTRCQVFPIIDGGQPNSGLPTQRACCLTARYFRSTAGHGSFFIERKEYKEGNNEKSASNQN